MKYVSRIITTYRNVDGHIHNLIIANFLIQIVNLAFVQILLIYMQKQGFTDSQSAGFISYRFLGVILLAVPLGLFIKGRKIKPLLYFSSVTTPAVSLLIIYSIKYHAPFFLQSGLFLWGISFAAMQITVLPYLIRNTPEAVFTEAVSLNSAAWSMAGIASGIIIFTLTNLAPAYFDEMRILRLIIILSMGSFYFIWRIRIQENIPDFTGKRSNISQFDWQLILKAVSPTIFIAIGAGLTIPFLSLFFFNVYGLNSDRFAIMCSFTTTLIFITTLLAPHLKRKFGFKISIVLSQALAIAMLVALATTQYYSSMHGALAIAVMAFIFRDPLMNMSAPLMSELMMKYIGEKNQEIASALLSAIWSGSWFISARIFKLLRDSGIAYGSIFLITAGIYIGGVILYYMLIVDYERRADAMNGPAAFSAAGFDETQER